MFSKLNVVPVYGIILQEVPIFKIFSQPLFKKSFVKGVFELNETIFGCCFGFFLMN